MRAWRLGSPLQRSIEIGHGRLAKRALLAVLPLKAQAWMYAVPLLVESDSWARRVDRVLVVDCSEATQVERVRARPGWTAESAQHAIAAQSPRAARGFPKGLPVSQTASTAARMAGFACPVSTAWPCSSA